MRKFAPLVIAVWAGTIFGLIEGILLNISREFPAILAPYKLSAHVVWFTPLYDIVLYSLVGIGLIVLFQLFNKWIGKWALSISFIVFIFLGIFSVLFSLKLIHLVSVLVLALGLTIVIARQLRGSEEVVLDTLKKRMIFIPAFLLSLTLVTFMYMLAREAWYYQKLPTFYSLKCLIRVFQTHFQTHADLYIYLLHR